MILKNLLIKLLMKKLLKWINPFKTATVNLNDNIKDLRQHNTQRRYFPLIVFIIVCIMAILGILTREDVLKFIPLF